MQAKQRQIRVLHIITNLQLGGAQDNTLLTIQGLDRSRYDVTLMCSPEGIWLDRARQMGSLNLIFVKQLTRDIHIVDDTIAFCKILYFLKKGRYHIIHTHTTKAGFLGRIAAKLTGIPVIIHTIHGIHFHDHVPTSIRKLYIIIERFLSKLSDKIVTVSTLNLEKAVENKFEKRSKFINVYSGIEFSKFDIEIDKEAKKKQLGISPRAKIVGTVGRLTKQKAPLDFVRAIPGVLKYRPDVEIVMVGDGELTGEIRELARSLNLNGSLKLLGYRKDVPEILQLFDIFVLPSLWEGLGRSLTEAMYVGCPVIATDVEGIPELVQHKKTGLLIPPNDPEAISNAILSLLNNEGEAKRIGGAAKKRISHDFSASVMVNRLEELYEEMISRKLPGHRSDQASPKK